MNIFGINLSGNDLWLLGIAAGFFALLIPHRLSLFRERRSRFITASAAFRSAFAEIYAATSVTSTANSRTVYSLLLISSNSHDQAAAAFVEHLSFWQRRRFGMAWKQYEKTRHSNPYSPEKIRSAIHNILRFCGEA